MHDDFEPLSVREILLWRLFKYIGMRRCQHDIIGSCLITLYDSEDFTELVCIDDSFMGKYICISLVKQDDPELPFLVWTGLNDEKHVDAWLTMMRLRNPEAFKDSARLGRGDFTDDNLALAVWDNAVVFPMDGQIETFALWMQTELHPAFVDFLVDFEDLKDGDKLICSFGMLNLVSHPIGIRRQMPWHVNSLLCRCVPVRMDLHLCMEMLMTAEIKKRRIPILECRFDDKDLGERWPDGLNNEIIESGQQALRKWLLQNTDSKTRDLLRMCDWYPIPQPSMFIHRDDSKGAMAGSDKPSVWHVMKIPASEVLTNTKSVAV